VTGKIKKKSSPKFFQMSNLFVDSATFTKTVTDPKLIGQGSFGCVFKAKYKKKEDVVVKFNKMDGDAAKRKDLVRDAVHESLMLALLNGTPQFPQLVAFSEIAPKDVPASYEQGKCLVVDRAKKIAFVASVQEVAGTQTLAEWIIGRKTKPVALDNVRSIMFQILWAIASVSTKYGVCLADVKPQNIMITKTDRKQEQVYYAKRSDESFDVFRVETDLIVKIIDLGGAYVQTNGPDSFSGDGWSLTYNSTVYTAAYASPDVEKKKHGTGEGDLYAAGLVFLILLAHNDGAYVFSENPPVDKLSRKLQLAVKKRAGLSGLSLLRSLLAEQPQARMGIGQYGANNYIMHSFFVSYYQGKENFSAPLVNAIAHEKPRWVRADARVLSQRELQLQQYFEARKGELPTSDDFAISTADVPKAILELIELMRAVFPTTSANDLKMDWEQLSSQSLPVLDRFARIVNGAPSGLKNELLQRCPKPEDDRRPAWWDDKQRPLQWIIAVTIKNGKKDQRISAPSVNISVPLDVRDQGYELVAEQKGNGYLFDAADYYKEMAVALEMMHHAFVIAGGSMNVSLQPTAKSVRKAIDDLFDISKIQATELYKLYGEYLDKYEYQLSSSSKKLESLVKEMDHVKQLIDVGALQQEISARLDKLEREIQEFEV
jgi:serine/threonine protein kinase